MPNDDSDQHAVKSESSLGTFCKAKRSKVFLLADKDLVIFFLFFTENNEENLYKMSNPVFCLFWALTTHQPMMCC